MDTTTKADMIANFVSEYSYLVEEEKHSLFFHYHDLGIPLAIMIVNKMVDVKGEGIDVIDETYNNLCTSLDIDNKKEYRSFDDFIEDSNIEDIDLEEE
jgi:hypothetical protein